jgi:hypothetical protein
MADNPPQPLLSATIPAYVYKQYADDDDIQAFFAAYNAATQTYVDWFSSVNLPFYPALTGDLLDWVAEGLYGLPRMSLAQTTSGALGPLNTEELNTATLNSFTPPSITYYTLTDDVFKRILTWNFYKGDGKRFNMMWLKRRIMRFLLGANGLDVNPNDPSFVIGTENTQAIGVQVASGVLTVSINQPYISSLVQLAPGIIEIFNAAFTGGVLELPLQYTYAGNVVTHLTATVNPSSESVTGIATTLSTGAADVSVYGGSGAYTFAWTWASGGTGITTNSPSAQSTTWTATGMSRGATLTGIALCTVTDTSTSQTAMATVSVTIRNVSVPSVSLAPSSISTTIATSTWASVEIVPTISGGGAPFTTAWTWQSGGAGITIASPAASETKLSIASISAGATDSGTLLCTVTDAYGQHATETCAVSVARASLPSASASPTSLSVTSSSTPLTTGAVTVTASGGVSPYRYAWTFTWISHTDGATESINSPSSATTTFTASGMSAGNTDTGTGKCTVTDSLGQQTTVNVPVSFAYSPPSPTQATHTSGSGTQTVPSGYNTVLLEVASPGGGGEGGFFDSSTRQSFGGEGGDSGTYCRSLYSCHAGQTLNWSIGSPGAGGPGDNFGAPGAGGTASISSGTLSITTMTAPGGNTGNAPSGGNQANTAFNSGTAGGLNSRGSGGTGQTGVHISSEGAGGNGGLGVGAGVAGGIGIISFYFSYVP